MNNAGERRRAPRIRANIEANWEGVLSRRSGTVVDVSATGCFILTQDDVREKELIRLEIASREGECIALWGEVVYKIEDMGFALQFTGSDTDERNSFLVLIETLREKENEAREDSKPDLCNVS